MTIAQWMGVPTAPNILNVLIHHMTKADIDRAKAAANAQVKAWGMRS
jgi:hypothetical protein